MLSDLPTVKAQLNVLDNGQDGWLTALLAAADAVVKAYLNRDVEARDYTDYYHGNNRRELPLRQRPVNSVSDVRVDYSGYFGQNPLGAYGTETVLAAGVDYCLELDTGAAASRSGNLIRIGTVWGELARSYTFGKLTPDWRPAVGSIRVSYNAGYAAVPADLKYAVTLVVSDMRRRVPFGGTNVRSETLEFYKYELALGRKSTVPELGTAAGLLGRYREVCF